MGLRFRQTRSDSHPTYAGVWKQRIPCRRKLRQGCAWLVQGPARRPLWLEPGEQGREQEEERQVKHFTRGPESRGRDWAFTMSDTESHPRVLTEE